MNSAVDLTFLRMGTELRTVTVVASSQHPGIEDLSWDRVLQWAEDIGKAFAAAYGGKWGEFAGDVTKFFRDLTAGQNVERAINGTVVWWQGGEVSPGVPRADEVRVVYRAWSEDSLKGKPGAMITAIPRSTPSVHDRGVTRRDEFHYEHSFAMRLDNRGPGGLLILAGAGDEGWQFNVAIATTLAVVLTPAIKQARHSGWLQQSNFGGSGNFELLAPAPNGGLAFYWRNNDSELLPWSGPHIVAPELGVVEGVSMIQSNFGTAGLGHLDAVVQAGGKLRYLLRADTPPFTWSVGEQIATGVRGTPALIQGTFGGPHGNYELIVPDASAGLRHYWRVNDDPDGPHWQGPAHIGQQLGLVDAVAFCQSTLGTPGLGNFELVARAGEQLFFLEHQDQTRVWSAPRKIADGVTGTPSIIQSRFGGNGNLEVVAPSARGGFFFVWRNNDVERRPWSTPDPIAEDLGVLDHASLIQSTFNETGIGNLELAVQAGTQITMLWRPDVPNPEWNLPQPLKPTGPFDPNRLEQARQRALQVRRANLGSV